MLVPSTMKDGNRVSIIRRGEKELKISYFDYDTLVDFCRNVANQSAWDIGILSFNFDYWGEYVNSNIVVKTLHEKIWKEIGYDIDKISKYISWIFNNFTNHLMRIIENWEKTKYYREILGDKIKDSYNPSLILRNIIWKLIKLKDNLYLTKSYPSPILLGLFGFLPVFQTICKYLMQVFRTNTANLFDFINSEFNIEISEFKFPTLDIVLDIVTGITDRYSNMKLYNTINLLRRIKHINDVVKYIVLTTNI